MKKFIKENPILIAAFSLPVLFIAGVALFAYLPSLGLSTRYDFIYTTCGDGTNYSYCGLAERFSVVDGKLVENLTTGKSDLNSNGIPDVNENYNARIFLHDTKDNESREITVEEAKLLDLSGLLTSPDGVTVSGEYSRGGDLFIFGGGSSYGYQLTKGKARKRINLINQADRYYYQNNFRFIGWVLPGRQ